MEVVYFMLERADISHGKLILMGLIRTCLISIESYSPLGYRQTCILTGGLYEYISTSYVDRPVSPYGCI